MINYCNTCKTIHTFPWYATIMSKNGGCELYRCATCYSALSQCSTIIYIHSCKYYILQQLQLLFGELQLQLKWGQIRIFRLFRFLELQLIATKLQFIYPKIATKLQFLQDVKFDFSKNTIVQFFKDILKNIEQTNN